MSPYNTKKLVRDMATSDSTLITNVQDIVTSMLAAGLSFTAEPTTTVGVGAKNGAAVAVAEKGDGVIHKSVFTLTALSITMTDADTAGCHGGHKVYDFPAGLIRILGATMDLTTTAGAGGIGDTAALIGSLGSVAVATDNAALTSTEADVIPSTAGTLTAGAGTLKGKATISQDITLDGTSTAADLYLNLAVPAADSTANDTVAVSGTITILWASLGDV